MDNTTHDDVIDLGIASVETLGNGTLANDSSGNQQDFSAGILAE
jgi:hypothetical protein